MSSRRGEDSATSQAERDRLDKLLDAALAATFPASDAIAIDSAAPEAESTGEQRPPDEPATPEPKR